MSHIDRGPLSTYNSLTDNHLNGFFSNTRMRRHLKKAGLITRYGEIVSENTYRLNMSRKEHKKHVKDMLAQAIVHKTLDLERSRQAEIKKKLEEIAKIELVRRVRATRQKKRDDDVLPYISPRSGSPRAGSTSSSKKSPKRRPMSTPARKGRRPMSALSSNYEDDDEEVVYLDDEGRPITPAHVDDSEIRYSSKDPIDTRHLYALDTSALRKYAMLMARMEQGRGATSPYLIPQVPIPPKSPHSGRSPRSAHRYRTSVEGSKSSSPKRPATAGQAYLHPAGSPKKHMGQPESMCEVVLRYHGSSLSLAREQFDRRQDIVVEQQHCGGNTLTVFKDKLEPDTKFSFISYRHRGYPFSLTIYIDGKMDCRVSTCCEDRHKKGGRIGGKHGHFSFLRINGAKPCYKCQVEKGVRIGNQAPKRKLKRPPPQMEEVVVVETKQEPQREVEDKEDEDKYDDDFDSSSSSSSSDSEKDEGALLQFHPKEARGIDQTTGKADINDVSESESDQEGKQQSKKGKKKKKSRSRSSSSSSSSSSSDREDTYEARKSAVPPPLPASPPAQEVKDDSKKSQRDARAEMEDKYAMFASYRFACADDDEVPEETDDIAKNEVKAKRKDSVTSTSSGSSKSSHDSSDDYSDSDIEINAKKSTTEDKEKQDDQRAEEAPVTRSDQAVPQVVIAEVDDDERVESREITGSHVGEEQEVYSRPLGGTIAVIEEVEEEDKEERKEEESNVEDRKKEEEEEKEERSVTVGVIASSNVEEVQKEEAATTVQSDQPPKQAEAPVSTAVVLPESPQRSVEATSPEEIPPPPDAAAPPTPEPDTKKAKKPDYSSSSSSDSDSSSDDSSSSDDDNTEKKGKVETQAMVHQTDPKEAASQKTSESDAETKDGGNDPDNVTSENTGVAQVKVFAEVGESKPLDGSILPLLEASQTTLEVKGVTLNKTQVYEVAQYLESAKEIRFFNLVNCGIDNDDVQKITEAMKVSASSPVLVNLSINPLSAGCVPHLLEMLKAKPCIEAIVLQGTRLGDDGVSQLVDGLLALHQERKMAAMEGEEKEKELNELDLSDAKFGDEGVASIARLIRSDMDIDTLTLSHNHAVNTSGWCTLGEALSHNTKLETLTLDHNFIEDSGLEAIAQGLYNNTTLTALDLNNVNITKASSKTLLEMLKRNTTILEITMAGNKIPESDVENIQRYIALNKSYN